MRIGMKRVAANTQEIYARWGLLDPLKTIEELLGTKLDGQLDDKHRINKDLRPDIYSYQINAIKGDKPCLLDITIQEKDTDLNAMMNCKAEWCKRLIVVVRGNQSS